MLCFRCYLVEGFLQMRCTHAVSQVSVCRMRQEELPLCSQSRFNVLPSFNILLTAVHHPDITWDRGQGRQQHERSVCVCVCVLFKCRCSPRCESKCTGCLLSNHLEKHYEVFETGKHHFRSNDSLLRMSKWYFVFNWWSQALLLCTLEPRTTDVQGWDLCVRPLYYSNPKTGNKARHSAENYSRRYIRAIPQLGRHLPRVRI